MVSEEAYRVSGSCPGCGDRSPDNKARHPVGDVENMNQSKGIFENSNWLIVSVSVTVTADRSKKAGRERLLPFCFSSARC